MVVFTRDRPQDVVTAPPKKRRRGVKFLLGFFVVMLALALVGVVRNKLTSEPGPAPVAAPVEIPNPAPVIPDTGVCSAFPAADAAAPLTYSPVTTWSRDGGTSVPSGLDSGPAFQTPFSWCYAHTATGALFAAANYVAQAKAGTMTPAMEITLAQYTGADTPDRASILTRWTAAGQTPLAGGRAGNYAIAPAQFIGFHFVSYDPETAVVEIANTWNDALSAVTYTLTWESGDWKIQLPADGRFPTRDVIAPIDSTYFIAWTAQGAG